MSVNDFIKQQAGKIPDNAVIRQRKAGNDATRILVYISQPEALLILTIMLFNDGIVSLSLDTSIREWRYALEDVDKLTVHQKEALELAVQFIEDWKAYNDV